MTSSVEKTTEAQQRIPSLTWPLLLLGLSVWNMVFGLVATFAGEGLPALGVALISAWVIQHQWRVVLPRKHRERELWRQESFKRWTLSELTEPTVRDWPEIERAMGHLLGQGTDPTVERAEDWLRHEKRIEEERVKLAQQEACSHPESEVVAFDPEYCVEICTSCGKEGERQYNPFGRRF